MWDFAVGVDDVGVDSGDRQSPSMIGAPVAGRPVPFGGVGVEREPFLDRFVTWLRGWSVVPGVGPHRSTFAKLGVDR